MYIFIELLKSFSPRENICNTGDISVDLNGHSITMFTKSTLDIGSL